MSLRSSSFDGSTFDGRDLFGFLAEESQFDSGIGAPYDIAADFVASGDQNFPSFDSFDPLTCAPQQDQIMDETELVSLMYQGYVFAKRIVSIRRASDPSTPLPFVFTDDDSKRVFYAGTCNVVENGMAFNTILCVPSYEQKSGNSSKDPKRMKVNDNPPQMAPMTSTSGITQTQVWEILGIFRDNASQSMILVNCHYQDVLRLLLDVFTDMPRDARAYFTSLLEAGNASRKAKKTEPALHDPSASCGVQQVKPELKVTVPQPSNSSGGVVGADSRMDSVSQYVSSAIGGDDVLAPVEQKIIEVVDVATNLWKDLTESEHEQQMSWSVFVERFCANPCNIMQTTASVVASLHSLFCPGNSSSIVTLESWQRFVCMFWVARPSDTLVVYNWAEADALLDQPWFCGMMDKASAQSALSRSTRPCSEFLIRCSDTLWRYGVFVLSKSYPDYDVCHTRIARHRPGESEYITLTRAGIVRFADLSTSQFVYGMTGERARAADMFYYAVPFADNPKPTRTVWLTLNALVADLNEHYKAQGFPYPLLPSKGMTPYHD